MAEAYITPRSDERVKPICFNVIMLGDSSVGKTELLKSYVKEKFDADKFATTGCDFLSVKYLSKDGNHDCIGKLWDTAG